MLTKSFPSITMLRMFARYVGDNTNIFPIANFGADIAAGKLPSVTFGLIQWNCDCRRADWAKAIIAIAAFRKERSLEPRFEPFRSEGGETRLTLCFADAADRNGGSQHRIAVSGRQCQHSARDRCRVRKYRR